MKTPYKPKNSNYEYIKVKIDGIWKSVLYHRYIWTQTYGQIPDGMQIHHKDENPLNNTIENLESIDAFQHNSMHHKGIPNKKTWITRKFKTLGL